MEKEMFFPPLSKRELRGVEISRKAAEEGMVLLKNDGDALPLQPSVIALYGTGAVHTIRGGTGSGDPFNGGLSGNGDLLVDLSPRYHINILPSMKRAGFDIVNEEALQEISARYTEAKKASKASFMEAFSFPEEELSDEILSGHAKKTDTAVFVISRNSGEGYDRSEKDDYCLSETELGNFRKIRAHFRRFILVLNVAGPISGEDLKKAEADAILLMGQAGQEGGEALVNVLTGQTAPSGKLTATWAMNYRDYPMAEEYLSDPDTSYYREGIYVGYRYFNTFGIGCAWPFGFGLSYTTFEMSCKSCRLDGPELVSEICVRNTGKTSGKEVAQLYVSAPSTELDMPYQELRGFAKTGLLQPGEQETLEIRVGLSALSSYSEAHGGYILSKGYYLIRIGNSSDNTEIVSAVHVPETRLLVAVNTEVPCLEEMEELRGLIGNDWEKEALATRILEPSEYPAFEERKSPWKDEKTVTYTFDPEAKAELPYETVRLLEPAEGKLSDAVSGKISLDSFIARLSDEELADLCCGTGWGVQDENNPIIGANSESVPGAAGETTHALWEEYGIPSVVMADGPGGVRISQHFEATDVETGEKREVYHYCIAWPVGTSIAQSFNPEIAEQVGRGMNEDLAAFRIQILLGPGTNIQRNPLCGRNFEYFSEDPYLSGVMAAAETNGIQYEHRAGACIKHYAANNQETNRHGNNSVIGQRALREIYLEPFRICIRDAQPLCIMTSYNLLNGTPTAESYDLCTNIARGEFGFKGFIMTDWNGGKDAAASMHAGNDLMMPGGPAKRRQIVNSLKYCPPEFDERGEVRKVQMIPGAPFYELLWNCFRPEEGGKDRVEAKLADGHTAEEKDGLILVDGKPVYTGVYTFRELMEDRSRKEVLKDPLTTAMAEIRDCGKTLVYFGTNIFRKTICKGDLQLRAKNIICAVSEWL